MDDRRLHPVVLAVAKEVLANKTSPQLLGEASFAKWQERIVRKTDRRNICLSMMVLARRLAGEGVHDVAAQRERVVVSVLGGTRAATVRGQNSAVAAAAHRLIDPAVTSATQSTKGLASPKLRASPHTGLGKRK